MIRKKHRSTPTESSGTESSKPMENRYACRSLSSEEALQTGDKRTCGHQTRAECDEHFEQILEKEHTEIESWKRLFPQGYVFPHPFIFCEPYIASKTHPGALLSAEKARTCLSEREIWLHFRKKYKRWMRTRVPPTRHSDMQTVRLNGRFPHGYFFTEPFSGPLFYCEKGRWKRIRSFSKKKTRGTMKAINDQVQM